MKLISKLMFFIFLLPLTCFSYNYGDLVDLPSGVKKLLPENPDILASASADLNGDKAADYVVIIQYPETPADAATNTQDAREEPRRVRELAVITADKGGYTIAARSKRAVLCSDCGATGEDPFLGIKAVTKSFTILHKFTNNEGGTWGIASKFAYSKRDKKWQLVYFSGNNVELKPADFDLINLEDFDVNYYMTDGKVEARPENSVKFALFPDDILFSVNGTICVVRPDGTNLRRIAGDMFFHQMYWPCWSKDRSQIAYLTSAYDLHLMNADATGDKALIKDLMKVTGGASFYSEQNYISDFAWSPDNKKFAYAGTIYGNGYQMPYSIYVADFNSGKIKQLEKGDDSTTNYNSVCWSPDSKKLAFYRKALLLVVDADTGEEKQIFTRGDYDSGTRGEIAWSPDGKTILTKVSGAFVLVSPDSGDKKEIKYDNALYVNNPCWSKDGKTLIFTSSNYLFRVAPDINAKPEIFYEASNTINDISW